MVTIPTRRFGCKDDARDALELAEGLRTGAIKRRVYKKCGPYSELRAAVRNYVLLTRDTTRAKNRLKALYLSQAIRSPGDEVYQAGTHEQWEKRLPPPQRESAKAIYQQVESLMELRSAAEDRLLEASKAHRIVKVLSTAPGIGPIRSAQIVATVVTPHRFRTSRQFWSYCGLAIVTRSSSDWLPGPNGWVRSKTYQTRGLNWNRHPMLKAVFKGAAHLIATRMTSHPLHVAFKKLIDGGMKPSVAEVTLARRLAATILAMWKHEEVYDPARHRSTIAQT